MAWKYRLEDNFCPACLDARHDECDGLNWWCTCWCIADNPELDGIEPVSER